MAGMKIPTCSLDPVPSDLVKDCLPAISPLISNTINSSFSYGFVPQILKLAAVTPILQKPGLNPDVTTNFQPISNLPSVWNMLSPLNSHPTSPPMLCLNHFNLASDHVSALKQPSSESPKMSSSP